MTHAMSISGTSATKVNKKKKIPSLMELTFHKYNLKKLIILSY